VHPQNPDNNPRFPYWIHLLFLQKHTVLSQSQMHHFLFAVTGYEISYKTIVLEEALLSSNHMVSPKNM